MDIKKTRRKEEKKGAVVEISNNITTNVTTNVTTPIMPENGWAVLAQFITYQRTFSVNELKALVGESMHINTIRSVIVRLKEKAWIRLYYRNTGKTHRENRYIVTRDGIAMWGLYNTK